MSENGAERPPLEEPSERQLAAIRQIRVVGDPVLREKARPVTSFDKELRRLSRRLIDVMHDAPGIGLAATQLGVMLRVLVYEAEDGALTVVNPEIVDRSDETEVLTEGCLSVPGGVVPVERSTRVRVRACDARGRPLDFEAFELEARVIQHELDHLDGVLILDRTSRDERARVLRDMHEAAPVGL